MRNVPVSRVLTELAVSTRADSPFGLGYDPFSFIHSIVLSISTLFPVCLLSRRPHST